MEIPVGKYIFFCSHASQRSAGVCTLKAYFLVNFLFSFLDKTKEKVIHWLAKFPDAHILLGGDFNITLDNTNDRWPPGSSTNTNVKLKLLMQRFDLIDGKLSILRAFTWCNNSRSKQSRIDLWLVSHTPEDNLSNNTLSTPLTDHKAIQIHTDLLPMSSTKIYNSYWKLNSSVLKHETVTLKVKELIHSFWTKAKAERVYGKHWKLLKFELGKFFRSYCCKIAKLKRAQEENIISTITYLSSKCPDSLSVEESNCLLEYQHKLDEF